MDPTALAANLNCLATRPAAGLSQASPTASSNRSLNGALLGNGGIFSVFTPQSGQRNRFSSTTKIVRYSKLDRSRTSRSQTSAISLTFRRAIGAHQLARFAAHPQLQRLGLLVDLAPIYPVNLP